MAGKVLRIGDVIYDVVKPIAAAVFLRPSAQGQKHPSSGEPLATLQAFSYRRDNGDVDFGQNLIARNSGVVRVGDDWRFWRQLGKKAWRHSGRRQRVTPDTRTGVTIDWQGQTFCGNNQQVLLEQLESEFVFRIVLPGWYLWLLPDTFCWKAVSPLKNRL